MRLLYTILFLSAVALCTEFARAHPDDGYREVITYYDPGRPPIIEWYRENDDKRWELISVWFDLDGDWALDALLYFFRGEFRESEYDPDRKNKRRLYAQADSAEAFKKDKTFQLDLNGTERLFRPPQPESPVNAARRQSKAYKDLLRRLAEVKLSPKPRP
jgi:hypothetical protein